MEKFSDIVTLLKQTILSGSLNIDSFFVGYLRDCLRSLTAKDSRQHRWSPDVLLFSYHILKAAGYNCYDNLLRGIHDKSFTPNTSRCNMILPCSSTLDHYFAGVTYSCGDTEHDTESEP